MTLNLIETINTSIYSPKLTNNTKTHFQILQATQKYKIDFQTFLSSR